MHKTLAKTMVATALSFCAFNALAYDDYQEEVYVEKPYVEEQYVEEQYVEEPYIDESYQEESYVEESYEREQPIQQSNGAASNEPIDQEWLAYLRQQCSDYADAEGVAGNARAPFINNCIETQK